jgi:hypothetical protein
MIQRIWSSLIGWVVRRYNMRQEAHEKAWVSAVKELHKNKVNRRFLVD